MTTENPTPVPHIRIYIVSSNERGESTGKKAQLYPATLSLSNINDIEMAQAKSGNWWEASPQRALSNNSVAYSRKPEMEQFIAEWKSPF